MCELPYTQVVATSDNGVSKSSSHNGSPGNSTTSVTANSNGNIVGKDDGE